MYSLPYLSPLILFEVLSKHLPREVEKTKNPLRIDCMLAEICTKDFSNKKGAHCPRDCNIR
jgi:hypothetical protein